MNIFTGLLPETPEDRAKWRSEQSALPVCSGREVEETLFDEPPDWMRIENQGQTNSCAPNAGTSVVEKVHYMKTGKVIQLCRNYLYLRGQQMCGIRGDNGCTLGGIIAALKKYGVCPEELWAFNQTYQTRMPAGCDEAAKPNLVTHTLDVESTGYQGFRTVIGQNVGGVLMAYTYPCNFWQGYIVERYQPTGEGGHAVAGMFLASRKDSKGRPYVWVGNSHSLAAQRKGWQCWSPDAIDELIESDEWGATGVTDMETPEPREVDWSGANNPFRAKE